MAAALALHLLSAVVWVGGMFFAYVILRPTAAQRLEPPQRLALWAGVFDRFFRWVWAAVVLLPATGYWMVSVYGGLGKVGWHVHLMQMTGWVMIALFGFLVAVPFPRLKRALADGALPVAAGHLDRIRRIVGINLLLGLVTVLAGSIGRYLPTPF